MLTRVNETRHLSSVLPINIAENTPCFVHFYGSISVCRTHRPLRVYLLTFEAWKCFFFLEAEANKLSTFKDTKGREGITAGRNIYMQI